MKSKLLDHPLKVTLSGLDERSRTRLAMFLQGPAKGVCEVVGTDTAEAAICDLDGFGGERQWQAFREQFHGPAVVMSVSEKHLHNTVWVRKPINADDFLGAIDLICQRLKTERRLREFELATEKALAAASAAIKPAPVATPRPVSPAPTLAKRSVPASPAVGKPSAPPSPAVIRTPVAPSPAAPKTTVSPSPAVAARPVSPSPAVASPRSVSPSPAVIASRPASPSPAVVAERPASPPSTAKPLVSVSAKSANSTPRPEWVPTASIGLAASPSPAAVARSVSAPPATPAPKDSHAPAKRASSADSALKSSGDAEGVGRAAGLAWNEQQIHDSCGTLDDSVYLNPARRAELYYEPDDYVQGILSRACQRAKEALQPIRVDIGGQELIVLAGGRQVFSTAREQRLRPLCVTPKPGRLVTISDLRSNELPTIQQGDPQLNSSETILWVMSLWASRGRVPKGTDIDAPVSLVSWPCYSRLQITPHAMQITSLWTSRPMSLMQTAKVLAIPHRYVFTLYSACLALGLIEETPVAKQSPATRTNAEVPAPAEKRSLMGGLLRKLRLAF
jgi:hypothetical protein